MASTRKLSLIDIQLPKMNGNEETNTVSTSERRWRRASASTTPWMNKIKPFFNGPKNDDVPECYNRVRYIRDSCKLFGDLWKTDKDFLGKSIDSDVSKIFKDFRLSDVARGYRSAHGPNGAPSVLNTAIDDLVLIHDYIDGKRKEWLDRLKKLTEQARDKQASIRQTMTEVRDSYERAQRKLEAADTNLKKFQTRSDRLTLPNFDERVRELDDIRVECESARTVARDAYATETYRVASEEHAVTLHLFAEYLSQQQTFYTDVAAHLSTAVPELRFRLAHDDLAPSFRCDLAEHCLERIERPLAYPIETCVRLLQHSVREEGLFRIAPSHGKQRKLVAELDVRTIDRAATLNELGYDSHVVASALKQYLRELPDCLLTDALFPQWNEAVTLSTDQARVQRIGELIQQLPQVNYDNLCHLVRFLARVAEYSSENKMTASNLGICIGCSLLYPKQQSLSGASISNTYASGSTILELMISHHTQFFPIHSNYSHEENPFEQVTFRPQPDLIPEFYPKNQNTSNDNLLDVQSLTGFPQPSPASRRKHKAPPPPPVQQTAASQAPTQQASPKQMHVSQMSTQSAPGQPTSNQQTAAPGQHLAVGTSSSFNSGEKSHRRSASGGNQLDRPQAPPPLPPPVVVAPSSQVQLRQTIISPSTADEQGSLYPNIEKIQQAELSSTTPASGNVGRLISELKLQMAAAGTNTDQVNNVRASSIRHSTSGVATSPAGEITEF